MTIQIGDSIPKTSFVIMTPDGPEQRSSDQIFKGKKIVLFGVAGAFTPVCDKNHLPGFLNNIGAFKGRGIDDIAVTSVNDIFVMDAWAKVPEPTTRSLFSLMETETLRALSGFRLISQRAGSAFGRSAMR